jgi:hypothetical protein
MPQQTNFNVSPYFDDYDESKNYYKVLNKPSRPIQAREINNVQAILQNQIEKFGTHIFKDGSVVIPGNLSIETPLYCVEVESEYNGIPISLYYNDLVGKKITGESSGVTAEVVFVLSDSDSERSNYTLYLRYLGSGGSDFVNRVFFDGETLITEETLTPINYTFQAGQGVLNTISENCISEGSGIHIAPGVYFVNGFFASVEEQFILLEQYSSTPSYKVGFNVIETVVTAYDDPSLYDNAQGYPNYAAPGADRLKIYLELAKMPITEDDDNFVEILRIENGVPQFLNKNSEYNIIRDELARRTYDESGDYLVSPFNVYPRDSLNDKVLNNGIYFEGQVTSNGNTPSEDLLTYQVTPGKAYVGGYDIEKIAPNYIDVNKPRTTETETGIVINYNSGVLAVLNNCYGATSLGLGTDATINLMSDRVGSVAHVAAGTTIGVARIYDFIPESDYVDDTSRLNLRLFDIQTYTNIELTTPITLSAPAHIKGKRSNCTGYLKNSVTSSTSLVLYNVSGSFLENEPIVINGIDDGRLIKTIKDYNISDVKSLNSVVGITTFNSDLVLSNRSYILKPGSLFNITAASSGVSTVTAGLDNNFLNTIKVGDIVSYNDQTLTTDTIYNKVNSISSGGTEFTIVGVTTVPGICDGRLPSVALQTTNLLKLSTTLNPSDNSLLTRLDSDTVSSINFLDSEILQRRSFNNISFSSSTLSITIDPEDVDVYFESFDEDRFVISYSDGTIEPMRRDKYNLNATGKTLTFNGLNKASGTANVIATVKNLNPSHKAKKLNRASTLIVSNSFNTSSGIGTTTLNDGLTYSNVYGTRVQDSEICLNVPDVVRVLAVYESTGVSDPVIPTLQLTSFTGSNNNNSDFIVGEYVIGQDTGAAALVVNTPGGSDIDKLEIVHLNTFKFSRNEVILGKKSGTQALITNIIIGDTNITQNFSLDDGQRPTIYDYSRIVRKTGVSVPKGKLKIVFQNYTIDSSDTGEFITVNSYPDENYKNDVPVYNNSRLTNFIDIRPRVAPYILSSRSPFEFNSRNFASDGQYSEYILAPDENIVANYSYYVGRIDRIFLNTSGTFEISQGIPSPSPKAPPLKTNSLDIATIYLPPYVFNSKNIQVDISEHKRYRMKDISLLENRIKRVENYTTLSLLESKTENFLIKDAETGLDRFKCGFFVDNFTDHSYHNTQHPSFRSSIDKTTNTLRPPHYTTLIDLQLGSEVISGIGQTFNPTKDHSYVTDLGSPGIKKTGDLITLDYNEVLYFNQNNATKSESVTPFLVSYWNGFVELHPPMDTWIDEHAISTTSLNNVTTTLNPLPNENILIVDGVIQNGQVWTEPTNTQTGISPTEWNVNDALSYLNRVMTGKNKKDLKIGAVSLERKGKDRNRVNITVQRKQFIEQGDESVIRELLPPDIADQFITQIYSDARQNRIRFSTKDFSSLQSTTTTTTTTSNQTTSIIIPPEVVETTSVSESVTTSTSEVRFLRSRNIEFEIRGLRPRTKFYPFFEGIDVSQYTFPKLLEVEMISGKFQVGETVESDPHFNSSNIKFRVCSVNHRTGLHNLPDSVYTLNPYTQNQIESDYTESSTFVNVDTRSLQLVSEVDYYGLAKDNMKIIGKSSGAVARVKPVRLISDNAGRLTGSLFIPDPNVQGNPKWINGQNTFLVTDSSTLQQDEFYQYISNVRVNLSGAEAEFTSSGITNVTETNILTTRNITITPTRTINTTNVVSGSQSTSQTSGSFQIQFLSDPLAQSFYVFEPSGIFLTSVEVYFETKDEELPVTLQIRPIINGVPSNTVVPFSEVTLDTDEVNLSVDGSVATRFTFPSPVYLNGPNSKEVRHAPVGSDQPVQYAVVLLSNSPQYRVFIAELGFNDIETGIRISQQPTLGSLFKSQNGITWTPAQLEDLKYKLYRADFVNEGLVRFFNPKLSIKNKHITSTSSNQFLPLSKKIVVGLGSTGYDANNVVPGVTIYQNNAYGTLESINGSVTVGTGVTVISAGIGYTNGTFTNVQLETETGYGQGATATVIVSSNEISSVNITSGGIGYAVGDSLLIPEIGQNVGFGGRVVVETLSSLNTFVLDEVQGQFSVGISTLSYLNSSGSNVYVGSAVTAQTIVNDQYYTGLHMKVNHMNHGLHAQNNYAKISSFRPLTSEVNSRLSLALNSSETTSIELESIVGFDTFENVAVSASNPGYVIIGNEVIEYTQLSGNKLSNITRGVDGTEIQSYDTNLPVYRYQFNGISLRRINKVHNLSEVDFTNHPQTFNSYYIKIDQNDTDFDGVGIGSDRTNDLYFTKTQQSGSSGTLLQGNIQFETVTPNIDYILPSQTNIKSKIRTITGTSISGSEVSFVDDGFVEIPLNGTTYFNTPKIIASTENETRFNNETPGNRSLTFEMLLNTDSTFVSPVIDTIKTSLILSTNLVNAPVGIEKNSTYSSDNNVRSTDSDEHSAIYISKPIGLKIPANSLKVMLPVSRNNLNDVRVLYQLYRVDSSDSEPNFDLFPGYSNYQVDGQGILRVIDPSLSDGSSDYDVKQTSDRSFKDYEYTIDDLPDFNGFAIKIVMASENQATPPIIKPIRVIATSKPRV